MAVYVDDAAVGGRWHHLAADTVEELHAFAARIGLRRSWFDGRERHPHYDVTHAQRAAAIARGAVLVDGRTLARVARASRPASPL